MRTDADVMTLDGAVLLEATTLERLCRRADSLRRQGRRLTVVCADSRIRRLLTVAGFGRRFDLRGELVGDG